MLVCFCILSKNSINILSVLNTTGKLGKIVYGMNLALGSVPVTVKMRTGVKDGAPTTHKLMPRIRDWGVGSVAVCRIFLINGRD